MKYRANMLCQEDIKVFFSILVVMAASIMQGIKTLKNLKDHTRIITVQFDVIPQSPLGGYVY